MRRLDDARVIPGGTRPDDVAAAFAAARAIVDGSGPAVAPTDPRLVAAGALPAPAGSSGTLRVPDGAAVVLATSGTASGLPRLVAHRRDSMVAAARGTIERLGGPGSWLLALPVHHVAGWQVLLRTALAGPRPPVVLDTTGGFDPARLAEAVRDGRPRYTALVPTQLARALAHTEATRELRSLDALLIGGSAPPSGLLERAREAGLRPVETYGMTETAGGCAYDGVALPGVELEVVDGRIEVAGPVLAAGYLGSDGTLEPEAMPTQTATTAQHPASPGDRAGDEPVPRRGSGLYGGRRTGDFAVPVDVHESQWAKRPSSVRFLQVVDSRRLSRLR